MEVAHIDELADFAVKDFPPVEEDQVAYRALRAYVSQNFKPWYREILDSDQRELRKREFSRYQG